MRQSAGTAAVPPRVSIVLPTYNREPFLGRALASIHSQTLEDWELIVVDDGGTDPTAELIRACADKSANAIRYLWQPNQGPAGARNAGIKLARAPLVAFFDSDDEWTPDHLEQCVAALDANPDVDWVYGTFGRSRHPSGPAIEPDVFRPGGKPAPFLELGVSRRGSLHVITDPRATECAISGGLPVGLKVSVLRTRIFAKFDFPPFRVGEDQALVVRALHEGTRLGYFRDRHGTAWVHDQHISEVARNHSLDRSIAGLSELVGAFESLMDLPLAPRERRALRRRIANEVFWNIGYRYRLGGRMREAMRYFRKGLSLHPGNVGFWKTYLVSRVRALLTH